jgi:hypothetical protein
MLFYWLNERGDFVSLQKILFDTVLKHHRKLKCHTDPNAYYYTSFMLLTRYATLLARYVTFLARYVTLFARYDTFFARYDTLLARYATFLTRYASCTLFLV